MKTASMFNLMLLFVLPTVGLCSSSTVVGQKGEDVKLPCTFDIKGHGEPSVCWNRGEIPNRDCNNKLIATGLYEPTKGTRFSSRYQLLGQIGVGDASLTILNVTESDAGLYGCRLRVPGLFNDEKHHINLMINSGGDITTTASTAQTATWGGSEVPFSMESGVLPTESMVTQDQESPVQKEASTLQMFIGNTLRLSFIIFIPALLLTAAHSVWRQRSKIDRRLNQLEEEICSV